MIWFYVTVYFILSILISIIIGNFVDRLMRKKFLAAINLVIPDYTPILGRKISNDPYVNSVLNDSRVRNDIEKIKNSIAKFLSLILSLIFVFFISSLYFSDKKPTNDQSSVKEQSPPKSVEEVADQLLVQFGPFGDLFNGSLTPFLTFATFTGLLITIIMQHMQMRATLAELQMSRIEMADSTDALQAQVKNSQAQKFDSNFYSMLQLHMDVADKLKTKSSILEDEFKEINLKSSNWSGFKKPDELRSFFLINYQILKFIKKNEFDGNISASEAKQYANIVRAMLSDELYGLIFINCSNGRFEKYRELVEHFSFLEHFVFSNFSDAYTLKIVHDYDSKVFGDKLNIESALLKKRELILNFIGSSMLFCMNKYEEIINDRTLSGFSMTYPEMRSFKSHKSEVYDDIISCMNKFDKFRDAISEVRSKISVSDFFVKDDLVENIIFKNDLQILKNFGFKFNEYVELIEELNKLVGNWYNYFAHVNPHLNRIKLNDN